jgi:hypothetical protein
VWFGSRSCSNSSALPFLSIPEWFHPGLPVGPRMAESTTSIRRRTGKVRVIHAQTVPSCQFFAAQSNRFGIVSGRRSAADDPAGYGGDGETPPKAPIREDNYAERRRFMTRRLHASEKSALAR